jgi:hypothetical protein
MSNEFLAFVQSMQGVIAVAKGLKSAHDALTIAQAQSDILEKLLSLQVEALALNEKHSTLIAEKRELEKQLVEKDEWTLTKQQYRLLEISGGSFVYVSKEPDRPEQPLHWLCAHCFDNERKKSILQLARKSIDGLHHHMCPSCKATIIDRTNARSVQPRFRR